MHFTRSVCTLSAPITVDKIVYVGKARLGLFTLHFLGLHFAPVSVDKIVYVGKARLGLFTLHSPCLHR